MEWSQASCCLAVPHCVLEPGWSLPGYRSSPDMEHAGGQLTCIAKPGTEVNLEAPVQNSWVQTSGIHLKIVLSKGLISTFAACGGCGR